MAKILDATLETAFTGLIKIWVAFQQVEFNF